MSLLNLSARSRKALHDHLFYGAVTVALLVLGSGASVLLGSGASVLLGSFIQAGALV